MKKIGVVKSVFAMTLVLGIAFGLFENEIKVHAELSTTDQNRMLGATSQDWQSTSLREWLNSEKTTVDYTALPPSYKDEAGFLSDTNFTSSERSAIAVTKHGHGWQYSLDGNRNDTLYFSQRSVAHNDYVSNDKVFILHYTDLVNFIEKNKLLMDRNKKNFSNYLQLKTNKKDKYEYVVNSGYYNNGYVGTAVQYTSLLNAVHARSQSNIVPALSLRPDFVLGNGKQARNLLVGDVVNFGKYNGEPIEWEVINQSDNGYPLLWSTKILTVKEYDKEGDINPRVSSYINFPTAEVDIVSGTGQAKSRETQKNIDSTTTISFLNESVLTTPTNETSITLQIKATDSKYGIRRITLPNGVTISGNETEWTFEQNGEYDIIVENTIGIMSVKHIVTKAINTPAEVNITTNKDPSTKWTNKPVTVTVSASNKGVYELAIKGNKEMGYNGSSSGKFPSWMPLGGKRLQIKGTLRNAMTAETSKQVDMNAKIRMRGNYAWYSATQRGMTYPIIREVSLKELYEKGEIVFDEIYMIPDNVYESYSVSLNLMDNNTAYMKAPYNYWISDFSFEILDKDDLKIEEITFPDGSTTNSDTASYVITNNGSYTFSAKDNRGKITSKTIQVAVDTVKPTLSISGVKPGYVKEQVLKIEGRDVESGVKRIKLPNGEYRTMDIEGNSLTVDYNIVQNGSYTFVVEDYAGNTYSKSISITNIDDEAPILNYTLSTNDWTNQPLTIMMEAVDSKSGVLNIELPDGNKVGSNQANYIVKSNGSYLFSSTDNLGNKSILIVEISKIDRAIPRISILEKSKNETSTIVNIQVVDSGDMK